MRLKHAIRKWLGISETVPVHTTISEEELRARVQAMFPQPEQITHNQLQTLIGEAFERVLGLYPETKDYIGWSMPIEARNKFTTAIYMIFREKVEGLVEKQVGTEEFLDQIIDRIKRKQLLP